MGHFCHFCRVGYAGLLCHLERMDRLHAGHRGFAESYQQIQKQLNHREIKHRLEIINEHIAQLKEDDDKRVKIIKKFYPKEYEEILEESKKEQDTGIVERTKSPLKNYEKKLYDLTLRILEEEKLTDDEYELLKEDIKISMDSIEKNE